jgi:hypothetical protein
MCINICTKAWSGGQTIVRKSAACYFRLLLGEVRLQTQAEARHRRCARGGGAAATRKQAGGGRRCGRCDTLRAAGGSSDSYIDTYIDIEAWRRAGAGRGAERGREGAPLPSIARASVPPHSAPVQPAQAVVHVVRSMAAERAIHAAMKIAWPLTASEVSTPP